MSKVITDLTSISTPDLLDLLLLHDSSVGVDKKITYENLRDTILAAIPAHPLFIAEDVKAYNVDGGTFTQAADQTRDLNTVQHNTIVDASLAADQITLPAGTYEASWACPAFHVNSHWSWLYNVTGVATLILGSAAYANTGGNDFNATFGNGVFTISVESVLEFRHRCAVTQASDGFGVATGVAGFDSIYTQIRIEKI